MKSMKFYDLKSKRSFTTGAYKCVNKSGRHFAVASTPSGGKAWRIVAKK